MGQCLCMCAWMFMCERRAGPGAQLQRAIARACCASAHSITISKPLSICAPPPIFPAYSFTDLSGHPRAPNHLYRSTTFQRLMDNLDPPRTFSAYSSTEPSGNLKRFCTTEVSSRMRRPFTPAQHSAAQRARRAMSARGGLCAGRPLLPCACGPVLCAPTAGGRNCCHSSSLRRSLECPRPAFSPLPCRSKSNALQLPATVGCACLTPLLQAPLPARPARACSPFPPGTHPEHSGCGWRG